jgi:hypothetical protein
MDIVFRSIGTNIVDGDSCTALESSLQASDPSEASILSAAAFLETVYADLPGASRAPSRAATPMIVGEPLISLHSPLLPSNLSSYPPFAPGSPKSIRIIDEAKELAQASLAVYGLEDYNTTSHTFNTAEYHKSRYKIENKHYMGGTASSSLKSFTKTKEKGEHYPPPTPRRLLQRPSVLPYTPDISSVNVSSDPSCEYAVVISMYEVYNDRIFDLLTPPVKSNATKEYRRRPLLFKSTELSPDRKVVAGLRKVVCSNIKDALLTLEAGLHERRVAGTGSNSVSSRSHGFFSIEVKKRPKSRRPLPWGGSALTIVDLAGSERARDAKTQGATLAEAGKINESLMYLGQCLQMQSDAGNTQKVMLTNTCHREYHEALTNVYLSSRTLFHSDNVN